MMKRAWVLVTIGLLLATPATAEMQHYVIGKPAAAKTEKPKTSPPASHEDADMEEGDTSSKENDYGGGSFVVTRVQDCFSQLKPGEAAHIRQQAANPHQECQKLLKIRAAQKEREAKKALKNDKKKSDKPATKPVTEQP